MAQRRGRLITFEGGEGSGKSTQTRRLTLLLRSAGIEALATREPGGVASGERIRSLLLGNGEPPFLPLTEAMLHWAARHEHVAGAISPALVAGRWVICDRFADSTLAYQGYGMGVDLDVLATLRRLAIGELDADLTMLLDLPVEEGLARAARRNPLADRYQGLAIDFHRRVREGFLSIARAEPARCVIIDASGDEDQVAARVRAVIIDRFADDLPARLRLR
ncbi:MAG: dTMP kinase [Rhodospirillales bacterium]|nr:dTMP kinase [Rhodospirillales bacterium]